MKITKKNSKERKLLHLPEVNVFSKKQMEEILKLAFDMKKNPGKYTNVLKDKTLVMWFEKSSLRTRLSFETGMTQLGGHAIYLDVKTTHKNKADMKDEISCLTRYADIIMARVYDHATIEEMMKNATVPVINGLCNKYHPCQAIADVMTIQEFIGKNAVVAYIGDGNNVCNSLISACNILGMKIQVATPENYKPSAKPTLLTTDPKKAVEGADVVYTDTWVSIGDEAEKEKRLIAFKDYQVNKKLIGDKYFLHCLPAIRGQEVTDEIMDSKKSLIYDQAENRMHAQKAIMLYLYKNSK